MNKKPWRDRFAKGLELLFAQRNTSAMTADARAQFELGASALAAVAAFWLWALATLQLRGGHFWQWAAALASALFVVLFGVRAAQLRGAQWRFALRAGARRVGRASRREQRRFEHRACGRVLEGRRRDRNREAAR
ncbi:MAG: hypothetical protein JNK05_28520 [Myxococcales bacterium]|nr:hypothetical protein [Myxococcales bacterium]